MSLMGLGFLQTKCHGVFFQFMSRYLIRNWSELKGRPEFSTVPVSKHVDILEGTDGCRLPTQGMTEIISLSLWCRCWLVHVLVYQRLEIILATQTCRSQAILEIGWLMGQQCICLYQVLLASTVPRLVPISLDPFHSMSWHWRRTVLFVRAFYQYHWM